MLKPSVPPATAALVRHFRLSLLWPLRLEPAGAAAGRGRAAEVLAGSAWQPVEDEFTSDPTQFQERHYKEFVTFLPHVQRFLYGEGRAAGEGGTDSPVQVFRRHDVAALRLCLREQDPPLRLEVAHVDLYFFFDTDVLLLNVELHGKDLPLATVQQILHRFGRAYPSGWDAAGQGLHNAAEASWLGAAGEVLVSSDARRREDFLSFACRHRAPRIAAHWRWLLQPLAYDYDGGSAPLRYRLLEYHRIPVMAFVGVDNPLALGDDDFVRLGLATSFRPDEPLPRHDPAVAEFRARYLDDRYWSETAQGPNTRFIATGPALLVVGDAADAYFLDAEHGLLAQFRHQYFMLFLIAHFHRAALLMFSGRLVDAINALDVRDADSVRRFKRRIRLTFEVFLRFTHRYWVHEISEGGQVQALFRRCSGHLRNDALYEDVKERIREMSLYLDSDGLRRQANTVVRLTVVTTFGLIATVATGFLGMNLIDETAAAPGEKLAYFAAVFGGAAGLILYAIVKSKRLSDFLEALSDDRLSGWEKLKTLLPAVLPRRKG